MMEFYTNTHQFYCGVDLHAKSLHACVVDASGAKVLHKNFQCQEPNVFLDASDAIDSEKIARLIRGGNFPLAHSYPKEHRATRDLLRQRTFLVRHSVDTISVSIRYEPTF
jgi:transposase